MIVGFNINGYFIKTLNGDIVAKASKDGNFYYFSYKKASRIEVIIFTKFLLCQDKFDT